MVLVQSEEMSVAAALWRTSIGGVDAAKYGYP
jgi:hypothetical protein